MSAKPPRSSTFSTPARQGLLEHPYAQLQDDKIAGPIPWLNPTRARFALTPRKQDKVAAQSNDVPGESIGAPATSTADEERPTKFGGARVEWRSRDNRKGRHVLVIPADATKSDVPQLTSELSAVARGIWRMCTEFAWWDVSWWIGVLFSVGSAIFVMCAFFYWLPLVAPSTEFPDEGTIAGGVAAFIGATLFQIGAILLIVEACNENQSGCFGWAIEHAFSHEPGSSDGESSEPTNPSSAKPTAPSSTTISAGHCAHHHRTGVHNQSTLAAQHPSANRKWEWWPTWHELRTHYLHEIGFLGSAILALGATIFYISGIMALPGIYNNLSQGVLWGVYWLAYLVGGVLFVVSSGFYIIETQPNWHTPAYWVLGWHIGVWNMIGSVGWTLSASFGYCSASWCSYQSNLSLLWASVAFMIGSLLLWYEALDKYPVERERKVKK